ncbi:UNVERIFIED_CONTAM: hypothetical protein RMT77_016542 [Armadillidium vulgare]
MVLFSILSFTQNCTLHHPRRQGEQHNSGAKTGQQSGNAGNGNQGNGSGDGQSNGSGKFLESFFYKYLE